MNPKPIQPQQKTEFSFPPAWLWLVDEAIPTYVKKEFSPKESWKNKPFTAEDAGFFFKGVEELSELFTEERPKGMPAYFQHPKYRSAYLLYFLPLQAAKFLTLFQLHPEAISAALEHGRKTGVLRVTDLGAGPGTASLSLLLMLLDPKSTQGKELPAIEFHWFDTNLSIMKDGKTLVELLSSHFPRLRGKVQVHLHTTPWWKAPLTLSQLSPAAEFSLTFMGHVLNESRAPQRETEGFWEKLFSLTQGGGVLMAEPAARRPSQLLSGLRDWFFESELIEKTATRIWGPCLHAEKCPLAEGRDWCHFSVPLQIPGKWFKRFSEGLGSERQWAKFSYLWMAGSNYPSRKPNPQLRRVISDPLNKGTKPMVLICEPEIAGRWTVTGKQPVWRGDLIPVNRLTKAPQKTREHSPEHSNDEEEDY